MAHIETWWDCGHGHRHDTRKEAERCALRRISPVDWAVSDKYPGKAVMVTRQMPPQKAIIEADMSDNITERKQQIEQMQRRES